MKLDWVDWNEGDQQILKEKIKQISFFDKSVDRSKKNLRVKNAKVKIIKKFIKQKIMKKVKTQNKSNDYEKFLL